MQAAVDTPIACTLDSGALDERLAWIRRVTERDLLSHRLDGAVLRLSYCRDALSDLEQIVARERECCSFLDFSLEQIGQEVRLTIEAPHRVGPDARWLFDQFLPQSPPTPATKACDCKPGQCG